MKLPKGFPGTILVKSKVCVLAVHASLNYCIYCSFSVKPPFLLISFAPKGTPKIKESIADLNNSSK